MAISVIQRGTNQNNAATSTLAVTLASPVTSGNAVIIITGQESSTSPTSVTDDTGNTYPLLKLFTFTNSKIGVYALYNLATAPQTFTWSSGFILSNLHVYEVSGLASASAFDATAVSSAQQSTATALDSGMAPSTIHANNLLLGLGHHNNTSSLAWTLGTGYSNLQTSSVANSGLATEEQIVSTAAGYDATFTLGSNSGHELTAIVAFSDQSSNVTLSTDQMSFTFGGVFTTDITKSLQYAVKATPSALTKSLKYTVKKTPGAHTKSLKYTVKKSVAVTKSLKYTIKAAKAVTKSLKYTIKKTPSALTKSLRYAIRRNLVITKSLEYTVKAPKAITKSLKYTVHATPSALTKSLRYAVKTSTAITKSLVYRTPNHASITESLKYTVKAGKSITKSLKYDVRRTHAAITKSLKYGVRRTHAAITKSLKYDISKGVAISKSLKYTVDVAHSTITKSLGYAALTTPINFALNFPAVGGNYVVVPNSSSIDVGNADSYSISLWFRTTGSADQSISEKWGTSVQHATGKYPWAIRVFPTTGVVKVGIYDGVHNPGVNSALAYNDGEWHQLVMVRDYANLLLKMYIDGSFIGQATDNTTSGDVQSGLDLYIGARDGGNKDFLGDVDDFVLYSGTLSSTDASSLYAGTYPPNTKLLWFPFTEGSGITVYDHSSNGNNGTIAGSSVLWVAGNPLYATQKYLTYVVRKGIEITKSLKYTVKTPVAAIIKTLKYAILNQPGHYGFRQTNQNATSGTSSILLTFQNVTNQGNLVVVNVKALSALTLPTVTDDVGNSYVLAISNVGTNFHNYQFYGVQAIGGAKRVTISWTGSATMRATIDELSGAAQDNSIVFDKAANSHGSGSLSVTTSDPISPAIAGELIEAAVPANGASSASAGSGYATANSGLSQLTMFGSAASTNETVPMTLGGSGTVSYDEIAGAYFSRGLVRIGLEYFVKAPVSAITKSLKYTVKAQAAAITKTLIYDMPTTTVKITKSLAYRVTTTPTALAKLLQYAVRTTHTNLFVNESMSSAPTTGTLIGSALPSWNSGGYLVLTTNATSQHGIIDYTGHLPGSFEVDFDFWTGGGSGADALWFYFGFTTTTFTSEDASAGGYAFAYDEYSGDNAPYQIIKNGVKVATTTGADTFSDSQWHSAKITVVGNVLTMFMDGLQVLTYTDSSFAVSGTHFGWGARTGGVTDNHYVRNLKLVGPIPYLQLSLRYAVHIRTTLAESLRYDIKLPTQDITKQLRYYIRKTPAVTKSLAYHVSILRQLPLKYAIHTVILLQLSSRYYIVPRRKNEWVARDQIGTSPFADPGDTTGSFTVQSTTNSGITVISTTSQDALVPTRDNTQTPFEDADIGLTSI